MAKKILMCEDDEIVAESFKDLAKSYGYEFCSLAKQKDRNNLDASINYILDNLENVIGKESPDYVLIDGLDGKCFKVAEKIREIKPEIISIIYTNTQEYLDIAKVKKITAFGKEKSDDIFKFLKERD